VTVVSASLGDGSAPAVRSIHSSGLNAYRDHITTIVYNAAKPCDLTVTLSVVNRYSTDPNMGFAWATLSQSNI